MDSIQHQQCDVLVIGSASIDTFIFPEELNATTKQGQRYFSFPIDAKIPVSHLHTDIGGGAANTAVGLARHGLKTALITRVGSDDTARYIYRQLQQEHVDVSYIKTGNLNTGISFIIQNGRKDKTIFGYRGANSELALEDIPLYLLKNTKFILINALYEQTANLIIEIIKKTPEHVKIAVTLGNDEIVFLGDILFQIFRSTYVLIVNEEESLTLYHVLTNNRHRDTETCPICTTKVKERLYFFQSLGIKNIGITLGAKGVKFLDETNTYFSIPAKRGEIVNTTGLGDAFFSGFLSYLVLGKSTEQSLRHGVDNATSVMEYFGAQLGLLRS